MNENGGRGLFYGVIGVATLIVAIIGATFAWFTATAEDTGNVTVTAGTLTIEYTDGTQIAAGNLKPATEAQVLAAYNAGNCKYQTGDPVAAETYPEQICYANSFTVTNTGTLAAVVTSTLSGVTNEFSNNLVYKVFDGTTLAALGETEGTALGTSTVLTGLPANMTIPAAGEGIVNTKTFTILIWLKSAAGNADQGQTYTATIGTTAIQTNYVAPVED